MGAGKEGPPTMRFVQLATAAGLALALLAPVAAPAEASVQEAFICTFKEGKTLADVQQVAAEFRKAANDLKGGKSYQAWILTPIASQNLDAVIWIGQMPDFPTMAAFNDAYGASEAAKRLGPMFDAVVDCESRSFWNVSDVK